MSDVVRMSPLIQGNAYHQASELKGLKVDSQHLTHQQLLQQHQQQQQQQQQQQYIVLAYDNESVLQQMPQSKTNVNGQDGFDIKEEKVTV